MSNLNILNTICNTYPKPKALTSVPIPTEPPNNHPTTNASISRIVLTRRTDLLVFSEEQS